MTRFGGRSRNDLVDTVVAHYLPPPCSFPNIIPYYKVGWDSREIIITANGETSCKKCLQVEKKRPALVEHVNDATLSLFREFGVYDRGEL